VSVGSLATINPEPRMASPINFIGSNFTFQKPADMTEEECASLHVQKCKVLGAPASISCWELSDAEREEVAKTGRVWLTIVGAGHPPVMIGTEKPDVQ
jgi:hypothetical protein